jgi:hypothetical protein
MGYGYIVHCDDVHARRLTDTELGTSILAAVGTDPYPVGPVEPLAVGPFTRVTACHSSQPHVFHVTTSGTAVVGAEHVDDTAVGTVPTMTVSVHAAKTRELMGRVALGTSRARVAELTEPDRRLADSASSLWWVYADALHDVPDNPEPAGAHIRVLLGTNLPAMVSGWPGRAIHKAFALLNGGEAIGVWGGNRAVLASELDDETRTEIGSRRNR